MDLPPLDLQRRLAQQRDNKNDWGDGRMAEPSPAGPTQAQVPGAYRIWFLTLMVLISAFSVIDRTAVLTLGQAIKQDLRLSDFQFGLISGVGFALFYAILGLPLARLADTWSRVRLITIAVAIFGVFAALCGLTRNFVQLMLCRIVVGVGEAGVQPPTVSVISDLYPPRPRPPRSGTASAARSCA